MKFSALGFGMMVVLLSASTMWAGTVSVPVGYSTTIDFSVAAPEAPVWARDFYNPSTPLVHALASGEQNGSAAKVMPSWYGVAVVGTGGDPIQVETGETLWLDFDEMVTLRSVTFSRIGDTPTNDRYQIVAMDDMGVVRELAHGILGNGDMFDLGSMKVEFQGAGAADRIGFRGIGAGDDYAVRDISITVAPLPGTLWGTLVLLGGAGIAGRIRRRMTR